MNNPVFEFRRAAAARGLELPADLPGDGKLRRCGTADKPRSKNGAWLLHLDARPAGGFDNLADGLGWETWKSSDAPKLSPLELRERAARIEAARRARAQELEKLAATARSRALALWSAATPAVSHSYLARKGVQSHGSRIHGDCLAIPLCDVEGVLHSLQFIAADGSKRFLRDGRKRGCFFQLGALAGGTVVVGEGFATTATLHEATGLPALAAFDCGNLLPVALAFRERYPRAKIVVAADDDGASEGNPGLTHARAAARAVRGYLAIPAFADPGPKDSDFNDMARLSGPESVRAAILTARRETARFAPKEVRP